MSHSINNFSPSDVTLKVGQLTIVNYTVGGEAVNPLVDLGVSRIGGAILGTVPAGQNSLAVPLFPILSGGNILLFRFVAGVPTEIPSTTALNAVIPFLVFIPTP